MPFKSVFYSLSYLYTFRGEGTGDGRNAFVHFWASMCIISECLAEAWVNIKHFRSTSS